MTKRMSKLKSKWKAPFQMQCDPFWLKLSNLMLSKIQLYRKNKRNISKEGKEVVSEDVAGVHVAEGLEGIIVLHG